MGFEPETTAVVGATGPTGIHVANEIARRGRRVRAVSRSADTLERAFGGTAIEMRTADAHDPDATLAAVDGCEFVVDCIGLPPERIREHPKVAEVLARVVERTGARCLQVSSYWALLPTDQEILSEDSPRDGDHPWYTPRREAEDILLSAGAAVVHLPDFFGPEVHSSSVQSMLESAVRGGPIRCIGSPEVERDAGYVPDLMKTVADLSEHDAAYGTDWAVPGRGPLSGAGVAEMASTHLGTEIAVQGAPPWMLKVIGLFTPSVRAILPIVDHYARPVRYHTAKIKELLGEIETTRFDVSIPATLDWIAARGT